MGSTLVQGSELLEQLIKATEKDKIQEIYKDIKTCETNGDHLTDEIFNELNNTFISPFDREDIHELCNTLDDVMDLINSSAKRMLLYQPKMIGENVGQMVQIIKKGCQALQIALGELKTINKKPALALEQCNILHNLEHEGDDVYEHFVKELFETETNGIELIKIKEIMQELEKTTDKANSVGKILKTIIVKYA